MKRLFVATVSSWAQHSFAFGLALGRVQLLRLFIPFFFQQNYFSVHSELNGGELGKEDSILVISVGPFEEIKVVIKL